MNIERLTVKSVTDQTGRSVNLPGTPQRIVSLVPSQTELLADLGLEDRVVGITKFCVHPEQWLKTKPRVGGTKSIHPEKIDALKPDLIIANKEENEREQVEALAAKYPVWVSDIKTLEDAIQMIGSVAALTGFIEKGSQITAGIIEGFEKLIRTPAVPKNACYLIWEKPWMTAGGDTFISSMVQACGFRNVFGSHTRYPETTLEEIRSLQPDIILLSSEPYPFREKQRARLENEFPGTRVLLVDGEMFSWYGTRLLHASGYFHWLLERIETVR